MWNTDYIFLVCVSQKASSLVTFYCSKILLLYNNNIYSFLHMANAYLRVFQKNHVLRSAFVFFDLPSQLLAWSSLCVVQIHRVLSRGWAAPWGQQSDMPVLREHKGRLHEESEFLGAPPEVSGGQLKSCL